MIISTLSVSPSLHNPVRGGEGRRREGGRERRMESSDVVDKLNEQIV
jgi:hypothetical protein